MNSESNRTVLRATLHATLQATLAAACLALLPAISLHAFAAGTVTAPAAVAAAAATTAAALATDTDTDAAARLRASMAAAKAAAAAAIEPPIATPATGAGTAFYQDLGGKDGVTAIVAEFIAIMLKDARIAATFDDVDMDRLHAKLAEQFCVAAGGPCQYTGKSMAEVHEDMKVNRAQFNASVEDLQLAMERRGISSRVQNRLLARLAPTQRSIVTR